MGELVDTGEAPEVERFTHPGVEALAEDETLCYRHRIKKAEIDALRLIPSELSITKKITAHTILMAIRMDAYDS